MKKNLIQKVLLGISTSLIIQSPSHAEQKGEGLKEQFLDLIKTTQGNVTFRELTDDEILLELNDETARIYRSLSPEGKALALRLASRSCNGMNECKGENACRTEKNACAGQGQCKGLTKCAISDKNVAVRLAAKKMAEKRQGLMQKSNAGDNSKN